MARMLGDPIKFSILVDVIKEWNDDDSFLNGVLLISVDAQIFPKEIIVATLRCEVPWLTESLKSIPVDKRLFGLPKQSAFAEIFRITFPDDDAASNDYRFDMSPPSLSDYHCFLFAVSDGAQVRMLAAKLNYQIEISRYELNDVDVAEAVISMDELQAIVAGLDALGL